MSTTSGEQLALLHLTASAASAELCGLPGFDEVWHGCSTAAPASSRPYARQRRDRTLARVELVRGLCCGFEWVGEDRAHCCARGYRGCGQVFDDVELFDEHRRDGRCSNPRQLGLLPRKNGIWTRPLDLVPSA